MSVLIREIRRFDPKAASVLEDANFSTDSDIQSLSREDLRELFPGNQQLKLRKTIFDIIHQQKPVDVLLEELRNFIPHESLRAALTGDGVLLDYLHILKNMKAQMDYVQAFIDAHINLLEGIRKPGPNQELQNRSKSTTSAPTDPMELYINQPHHHQDDYGSKSATADPGMSYNNQPRDDQQGAFGSKSATSAIIDPMEVSNNQPRDHQQGPFGSKSATSATIDPMELSNNQPRDHQGAYASKSATSDPGKPYNKRPCNYQQGAYGSPGRSDTSGEKGYYEMQTVKYQVVVSGETFGAHGQLLDKIKGLHQDRKVQLDETNQDPQVIFVFCPIVSRLATDANAALGDVKVSTGQESIILVLMHHVHEVKCVTHLRTWEEYPNVVSYVHVFYHEKARGLLMCQENQDAVSQIQGKLLDMYPRKYIITSAQNDNSSSQNDAHNSSGSNWKIGNIFSGISGRK